MQHLIWALEEIEKSGNVEAAQSVRIALEALRKRSPPASIHITAR